jgi:hypothetical protein
MGEKIGSYKELRVYQTSMDTAMGIFLITKAFPVDEIRQCLCGVKCG